MDNWYFRVFLVLCGLLLSHTTQAAEDSQSPEESYLEEPPTLAPNVVRLGLKESELDDENFEIGVTYGFISVENFGTHDYLGLRAAWHMTEDLFFEANYGYTKVDETPAETISDLRLFNDSDREFNYYNLSVGFNILPGEVFLGKNRVYNNAFYVIAGAGNLDFLGDSEFALNLGAGLRLIITDSFAVHFTFQDIITDKPQVLNPNGESGSAHNMQYGASITYFF